MHNNYFLIVVNSRNLFNASRCWLWKLFNLGLITNLFLCTNLWWWLHKRQKLNVLLFRELLSIWWTWLLNETLSHSAHLAPNKKVMCGFINLKIGSWWLRILILYYLSFLCRSAGGFFPFASEWLFLKKKYLCKKKCDQLCKKMIT